MENQTDDKWFETNTPSVSLSQNHPFADESYS